MGTFLTRPKAKRGHNSRNLFKEQRPIMLTTTIGAYPKPAYVDIPDWFSGFTPDECTELTKAYNAKISTESSSELAQMIARGVADVVRDQVDAGIDIVTDGEIARDNYLHYHCRHLDGIDFEHLTERSLRHEGYRLALPTWVGPVKAREPFLPADWRLAQACTERPVKMTVPGPMSLVESTSDEYYGDTRALGAALADALNTEILALAEAGCRYIQIDEPLFARLPERALEFGIGHIERCVHGVPAGVHITMHMCCGYPYGIDNEDNPKAPKESYFKLAEAVDACAIDAVSIEDAHRHNDLMLLEKFRNTQVLLGVVAIARSRIEEVEEIRERLGQALEHIDAERLVAAPDCGLGYLTRDLAMSKLANMCQAATSL